MSTQSNRSTHYLNRPLGLKGNDKEVLKDFFTHGQESQDDDDHSHWNIDIQEQRFRELSPIEVMKTDPSVILKSLIGVTLSTLSVYFSIPVVLSDPTWVDLSAAALSIIASTLFIVYVIWRDKKKIAKYYDYDDNGTEHDNDKVYHAGYDNPTFSRKYRLDIYLAGSVLVGQIPESILKEYDFAKSFVRKHEKLASMRKRRDSLSWDPEYTEKYLYRYDQDNEKNVNYYKTVMVEAFNISLNDPVTHFQTKELAYTLAEYNEKVPWDIENDFLLKLIHSFFTVIDEAWNRHREKEKEETREMILRSRKKKQEREEAQKMESDNAREEAERKLNTVEAFNDLKEENPFHHST